MDIVSYSQRLRDVIFRLKNGAFTKLPTVQTGGNSTAINGDLESEISINLALDESHDGNCKSIISRKKGRLRVTPMGIEEYADRLAKVVSKLSSIPERRLPQDVITRGPGVTGGGPVEDFAITCSLDSACKENAKSIVDAAKLI